MEIILARTQGFCPGATSATLSMITAVLREKYKPNVTVKIA